MAFAPEQVDLCCLGDSITQKFEWQDAFPGLKVANRGIGSDTTQGIIARLDSVERIHPKVISLMAGINDLSLGRTPEEIVQSYEELLHELRQRLPGATIVVSSVLPVAQSHTIEPQDIRSLNALLRALCEKENLVFLDMFDAYADENGYPRPEYNADGVHLTAQGYSVWLSYLSKELRRSIG